MNISFPNTKPKLKKPILKPKSTTLDRLKILPSKRRSKKPKLKSKWFQLKATKKWLWRLLNSQRVKKLSKRMEQRLPGMAQRQVAK